MDAATTLHAGYVLHARSYRETSLLLEIFTREHGRLGAVARGAARRGRQSRPQPFEPWLFGWRGARDLVTLTGWESGGRAQRLQGTALVSGLYLNELLVRLLERQDPHPTLHDTYSHTLPLLGDATAREPALRRFEMSLVAESGYGIDFASEGESGEPVVSGHSYRFREGVGLERASGSANAQDIFPGASLLALAEDRLDDAVVLRDAKHLMRIILDRLLDGRPLVSRALLRR